MGIAKKFNNYNSDEIHENDGSYILNMFGAGFFNGKFRGYKDLNNKFGPNQNHTVVIQIDFNSGSIKLSIDNQD